MVTMILVRTVQRDLNRYNAFDLTVSALIIPRLRLLTDPHGAQEDVQEDYGWKLVHGEVFRSPRRALVLSVAVGSGAQLVAMTGVTLFFALLGFLSPSNRGSLSTVMIVCWTLFSGIAGYVSSRLYISLDGQAWKQNVAATAIVFPT
jgi:transmembrane 9 superfamily protein 2/4